MPSHFRPVELKHASRLINHGPTILVTTAARGRRNAMAAAWSMPVEFSPPRVAVVIDKQTFTRELLRESGVFGICIPGAGAADLTYALGSASGRDGDKFAQHQIDATPGPVTGVPLIASGCVAWLECRWLPEPRTEDLYDTCFAEVVYAAADARVFADGHWNFNAENSALHTIHHLGAGNFAVASEPLRARGA